MNLSHMVITAAWLVFLVIWLVMALSANRSIGGRPLLFAGIRAAALAVVLGIFVSTAGVAGPSVDSFPELFGALCTVLGIAIAVWARLHLGTNWGMPMTVKESPELIMTGPYAFVRHPIYTGVIMAIFGSTLASGGGWVIVSVAAAVYFFYSATKEEVVLAREFPQQYPAYKARTKMLIPFIF